MIRGGPTIASNGLVLDIDAANIKSYVSGSLTMNDLSNYNNSGSLISGAYYTGSNCGSIVFDGINDYVDCGATPSLKMVDQMSVNIWIWFNSLTADIRCVSDWHQSTSLDRWIFYITSTTVVQWYVHTNASGDAGISYTTPLNTWLNFCGVYTGPFSIFYVNGNEVGRIAKLGTMVSGSGTVKMGRQTEIGGTMDGKISSMQIYNRALTAYEVLQNYNAMKGRFGIN